MTERRKLLVVTSIDSAEESRTLRLNCQDDFAGTWSVFEGVTPPISGLADFVQGIAAAHG
jgi:hypothetical protein